MSPATVALVLLLAVGGHRATGATSAQKRAADVLETADIVARLSAGGIQPNAAVNRVTYLDQEEAAVAQICQTLQKPTMYVTRGPMLQALALLAKPGQPSEAIFLKELGGDEVADARVSMQGLARLKSKRAVPLLEAALSHRAVGMRLEAARTLGAIGEPKSGAALVKAARTEADLETRATMLIAVGQVGDHKQQPALEAFLSNSSETSRQAAARGLCLLGAARGLEYAKKALTSEDKLERQAAVLLLDGAPKAVAPLLRAALEDTDHTVRARAARMLVQQGDRSKLAWLVVESYKAPADLRGPYETELEALRITDEERRAIRTRAGLE